MKTTRPSFETLVTVYQIPFISGETCQANLNKKCVRVRLTQRMKSMATSGGVSLNFQERDGKDQRKTLTQTLRVNQALKFEGLVIFLGLLFGPYLGHSSFKARVDPFALILCRRRTMDSQVSHLSATLDDILGGHSEAHTLSRAAGLTRVCVSVHSQVPDGGQGGGGYPSQVPDRGGIPSFLMGVPPSGQ